MKDFILPDIGEGIVECEIVEWRVHEGDVIEEDQPVCDVMTDKALVEIPSIYSGKIVKLYYQKGETAKVHSPLFSVEVKDDAIMPENENQQVSSAEPVKSAGTQRQVTIEKEQTVTTMPADIPAMKSHEAGGEVLAKRKVVSSPSVRRLAREMNIDLRQVKGSGEKGRVYKEDVYAFTKQGSEVVSPLLESGTSTRSAPMTTGTVRREPITGMMAVMAKRMSQAVQTIPHFTFCEEIDVTDLVALRNRLKESYEKQEIRLTMMPFFMKALSLALKAFPQVNVQTDDQCRELAFFEDHNIGLAVNSKTGLVVPNIKQCQNKSIRDIAMELSTLIESAREGRVSTDRLKGGTITISNIGALGGTVATPIINYPEAAIVAMGRIQKLPRFDASGVVCPREIMQVSWSADHRIIDGATITLFNNQWKRYLEDPSSMLPELV